MEISTAWIAIVIVVLSHIVSTVWWAARVSTLLQVLQQTVEGISIETKSMRHLYATKEDLVRETANFEKDKNAMWNKIDKLTEKIGV